MPSKTSSKSSNQNYRRKTSSDIENQHRSRSTPTKRNNSLCNCYFWFACSLIAMLVLGVPGYIFLKSKGWLPSFLIETTTDGPSSSMKTISMQEVAKHSDETKDCWVVFHDKVYDMTEYAQTHTGSGASPNLILKSCGADGTSSFEDFHNEGMLGSVQKYLVGEVGNGEQPPSGSSAPASPNSTSQPAPQANPTPQPTPQANPSPPQPTPQPQPGSTPPPPTPRPTLAPTPAPVQVPSPAPTLSPSTPAPRPTCTTAQDLQTHNNFATDCWIVYHGSVYDMTQYLHTGGAITDHCGTDSTQLLKDAKAKAPNHQLPTLFDFLAGRKKGLAC